MWAASRTTRSAKSPRDPNDRNVPERAPRASRARSCWRGSSAPQPCCAQHTSRQCGVRLEPLTSQFFSDSMDGHPCHRHRPTRLRPGLSQCAHVGRQQCSDLRLLSLALPRGKGCLSCDRNRWTDERILRAYRGPIEAEAVFGQLKDEEPIAVRPQDPSSGQKICGHTLWSAGASSGAHGRVPGRRTATPQACGASDPCAIVRLGYGAEPAGKALGIARRIRKRPPRGPLWKPIRLFFILFFCR